MTYLRQTSGGLRDTPGARLSLKQRFSCLDSLLAPLGDACRYDADVLKVPLDVFPRVRPNTSRNVIFMLGHAVVGLSAEHTPDAAELTFATAETASDLAVEHDFARDIRSANPLPWSCARANGGRSSARRVAQPAAHRGVAGTVADRVIPNAMAASTAAAAASRHNTRRTGRHPPPGRLVNRRPTGACVNHRP